MKKSAYLLLLIPCFILLLLIPCFIPRVEKDSGTSNPLTKKWKTLKLNWVVRYSNDAEKLERLIAQGGDVNSTGWFSKATPLHTAAYLHKEALLQVLVSNGANVNAKDEFGFTALHYAAGDNRIVDENNESRDRHKVAIVSLFVGKNVDIDAESFDKNTPLHMAAKYNNRVEIAREIIKHNANINAQNRYQQTPLHIATLYQNIGMIRTLIENDANLELQDRDKKTARDIALETENKEIIALFDGDKTKKSSDWL